ncbi:MAG: phosphonoacetate hydrolase [Rhodospirillaceae bacterium]|nr:phosphonoacetate hydrolase [Rhodospirillaceae bacterium]|tara:strand:- start:974 stop:2218 length:1245 start_codon:yes stop_codon:yes gene_type:complete
MEKIVNVNGRDYRWPRKTLIVICIDGSEPDYIEKAVQEGVMPFTEKMIREGADLRVNCVIPSFTNPNNISIITGCPPSVHGISGNFFYDSRTGTEVMMNDPKFLRVPTILSAFEKEGAKVAIVTAKDKLRRLLGHGLNHGKSGSICVSAEKADEANFEENGCEGLLDLTGLPLPSVYSADLSEFVFATGVKLMQEKKPDIMYLSTTDYIQHKFAPGTNGANDFYKMMDDYWATLRGQGADLILTADHGMNAKHDEAGNPDVIYLQEFFDEFLGIKKARVILPITDPYTVHHGALGSFATVYLSSNQDINTALMALKALDGVEMVLTRKEACDMLELPEDRMGDIIIISDKNKVLGINAEHHDLSGLDEPLRSHGGISEQIVPLITSSPLVETWRRQELRNFDAFHVGLNLQREI